MKTKSQLTLVYFLTCIALVPVFAISGYFIFESRQESINEKISKLHSIATSKQVTLENHLGNYIKSLESFAKNKSLISALKNKKYDGNSYDLILKFQEEMWGASHHIFIADIDGHIVLSPHHGDNKKSSHAGHSISTSKYFKKSLEKTQITDFFGFEESTHYHQLAMVPVKSNGKTLGVIISEITIQYFIDLLKQDFELGKTGKIYLSTDDFQKVVHLKKDKILNLNSRLLKNANASGQAFGRSKSNGKEVFASYLKSKKYPWYLAVEIDSAEALAPINRRTTLVSIAYIVFVGLFLFIFRFIIKILQKPAKDMSGIIEDISKGVISNSNEMKGNTSTLVEGSLQLAEALVQNQGQLEQVVGDIKNDSNITRETLEKAQIAKNTANEGEHIVKNMTRSIAESCDENQKVQTEVDKVLNEVTKIVESIKLIQDKTQLINDIVFQTKLLSFNASVEAARAGEHGKGFSVVAEEVGKLAEVSGKASLEIHEMIEDSVKQVEEIVDKSGSSLKSVIGESTEKINATKSNIDKCNELFLSIIGNVNNIHSNITEVSRKAEEKVVAIDEVNDRFVNLKLVSEQSSTVAHTVSNLTNKLQEDSTKLEQVSKDLNEKFGT